MTILAALLPVALLFFYIYRQDAAHPEPPKWLWKGACYGVASALLVILVVGPIPDLEKINPSFAATTSGAFFRAFAYAAIPEEAAKLLMLWLLIRRNPFFDEHFDGIVYATCVGLGFAGFENIGYLLSNSDSLFSVAFFRGIFAVPGHFFFAVAMGYFVSLAFFKSPTPSVRRQHLRMAFIVPVVLHGLYDGLLMAAGADSESPLLAMLLLVLFLVFCHYAQKRGRRRIALMKDLDKVK